MTSPDRLPQRAAPLQSTAAGIHAQPVDSRPLKVLIHRVGSLGDTLIALPALRLIAAAFPNAQRLLLSNTPVSSLAQPAAKVLEGLDLIDGFIQYESDGRAASAWQVIRAVRRARPDVVVSLSSRPGRWLAVRDRLLFLLAGIRRTHGLGWSGRSLRAGDDGLWERESQRLVRLIGTLGTVDWSDAAVWGLQPSDQDRASVARDVPDWRWQPGDICLAVGTKFPANDWGAARWLELVQQLATEAASHRLVCIGLNEDRARAEMMCAAWPGVSVNLCGQLDIRGTAAVVAASSVLIGHDSGPIHLAAAVGTPTVAVFSRRNVLGKWFPMGDGHAVQYSQVDCAGCGLARCDLLQNLCTRKIAAEGVAAAARARL